MFTFSIIVVLFFSFLFSGTEAALLSLPAGEKGSQQAEIVKQKLQSTMCSLVLGNNVANICGSIILGRLASQELGTTGNLIFPIAFTILVIIFGEIIPKSIGEARSVEVINLMASILLALNWIFAPIQCVFNFFLKLLPQKEVVQDEEELVEAARSLDSTPIHELMKPGSVEQCPDYCKTVSSFIGKCIEDEMSDVVLKRLYKEEYLIIVLNREGLEIGWVNRDIAFEWLFDHWGE